MTNIENLSNILAQGGLWSDAQAARRGVTRQGIGHAHIKQRRANKPVRVGPGGRLCDYVPFYFGHHSPMLYAVKMGAVQGYTGGQEEVIYLATNVETVLQAGSSFVFTDGHAAVALSQQYTDMSDLAHLDWPVIKANFWKNTDQDWDRERRKQAEFLVHDFVPWPLILGIGVMTQAMADRVAECLVGQTHQPAVRVMRAWYY